MRLKTVVFMSCHVTVGSSRRDPGWTSLDYVRPLCQR